MKIRKTIAAFLSACLGASALCTFPVNAEEITGMKFNSWQDAYWYFLNVSNEGKEPDEDRTLGPMYETRDITGDGIPELFISESAYPLSKVYVYTYHNGTDEYLMSGGGNGFIGYNTDKSHEGIYLITSFMNQGITTYKVDIYNNKTVSPLAVFTSEDMYADEKNPAKYTFNDKEVTKEEFDKEFSKYKDLEISYVGRKDYFDERYPIIDDVVYYYYFDHFEVAGADNDIKNMKIADEVRGIKVTGIHEYAAEKHRKLESVTFGKNIEFIGRNSFEGCSALKSVTIPENVKDIGEQAFLDCGSLEDVTILNPECSIWDFWEGGQPLTFCNTVDKDGNTVFNGVIKGQKNSTAEKYAGIFKLDFEEIESKSAEKIIYGDVNDDSIIDAKDATAILTAYSKSSVIDGELGFDDNQKKAADVNRDNIVDGKDATSVLTYYARTSSGYGGTLEEFMNNGYSFD